MISKFRKIKSRKIKSRKIKSRKIKSRKIKSRKIKSKKIKSRKNKSYGGTTLLQTPVNDKSKKRRRNTDSLLSIEAPDTEPTSPGEKAEDALPNTEPASPGEKASDSSKSLFFYMRQPEI